jgi:hypothetical protein
MAGPVIFTAEELTRAKIFRDSPSNDRKHRAGLLLPRWIIMIIYFFIDFTLW